MWDDIDLNELFAGGDLDFSELQLDFSELPEYQPLFELQQQMGPDVNLTDWMSDWAPGGGDILSQLQNAGGNGGDSSGLLSGLKGLLGGGGKGGGAFGMGSDILSLLGLLGAGAGAWNANKQTDKASEAGKQAAKDANAFALEQIGGARKDFLPYQTAGTDALAGIQALLGGDKKSFAPLKSHQMKPLKGSMSLAQLAAR
jgi:hypothetical protein